MFYYSLQLDMLNTIETYLKNIEHALQADNATEHTHRPALFELLKAFLPEYRITNEPRHIECGAPDFEIALNEIPIGHLEAKDIGTNLNKIQQSEQIKRYLGSLNNLILTDYLTFQWFANGDYRSEMTVILGIWDTKKKKLSINKDQFSRFEILIKSFIETQILTLRTPEELAAKMAHIARLINDVMLKAYHQENGDGKITEQLNSFRSVLMDTLKVEQFTDMVAQTICYGLFAAKCTADLNQPFSRIHAGFYLPKTNPFLRNLFNQIAGIDLDERLVWMVEHLVAVLNRSDIAAILEYFGKQTRKEDPVVHFYETFLAQYDPKLREVRGVYYTPEPVVSYIVRSVDLILKYQFKLKKGLADSSKINEITHKVQILDPATGTGTFLYSVIAKIFEQFSKNKGMWSGYVSKDLLPRLHGFELLMAAYTVAHMKLGLQLKEYGYDFKSKERLKIFLTNTLDEPHDSDAPLLAKWLSDEANQANYVKKESPVMVILGNPPYSGHSANTGEWIKELVHDYKKDFPELLKPAQAKWLQDDYVKFIRFSQWRINQTGYGVLGFVTNHSYLDNPTFRGMRQLLMQDFDEIYILDLHGNSKKKEQSPNGSVDKNVFDIQQGIAISIFIKHKSKQLSSLAKVHHAHLYGERKTKYHWLSENDLKTTQWKELQPQAPFYLFIPQNIDVLAEYEQYQSIAEIMNQNGDPAPGVVTTHDEFAISLTKQEAKEKIEKLLQTKTEAEARNLFRLCSQNQWNYGNAKKALSVEDWQKQITPILYRPFDIRWTIYNSHVAVHRRERVMQHMLKKENLGLTVGKAGQVIGTDFWDILFCSKTITEYNLFRRGGNNLFPLYLYPSEKDHFINGNGNGNGHDKELPPKANFSPEFIKDIETKLKLQFVVEGKGDFNQTISALDIFHYMYAIFHSPTYRKRYAEFLKMDFPRLPVTSDKSLFEKLTMLGEQLVNTHLMKADIENDSCFPITGNNVVEKIDYKDNKVYINKTQYFDNVALESWEFHIGGYQVCQKWLKDRKDRALTYEDCTHYLYILAAIENTQKIMKKIDETTNDLKFVLRR